MSRIAYCHEMGLLQRLSTHRCAFYFVERGDRGYRGSRQLQAQIAHWLKPGEPFAEVPDLLPLWQGSVIPFETALRRWGFPEVWAVLVGCASAPRRRALVKHVRDNPPRGMFDVDAEVNDRNLPLSLTHFIMPDAALRLSAFGRGVDRDNGLDHIGFRSDDEAVLFDTAVAFDLQGEDDVLGDYLLRMLSRGAGRQLRAPRVRDGFDSLVDHAFELFHMGAVSAAGTIAGAAFEQLMQAGLTGPGREWLEERRDRGDHIKLNDVIGKLAKQESCDDRRLRRYQHLRNDLAHRLGDAATQERDPGELAEQVQNLLDWLDDQDIQEDGAAAFTRLDPEPELTFEELYVAARDAADAAARSARTTRVRVGTEIIETDGAAWVIFRDPRRPFTAWLLTEGHAELQSGNAVVLAPGRSLERNLDWVDAFAQQVGNAGHVADYAAMPL